MSGYSPILELGDDPRHLTPREKMENALYSMEDWRHASPEYLIENILTALASSGDHAELARLSERNVELSILAYKWMEAHHALKSGQPYDYPSPADMPDLIAEVAALRAENEHVKKLRHQAIDRSRLWEIDAIKWETRATEAERKLAEAVGLLESFKSQARVGYGGVPVTRSRRVNVSADLFHQVCTWLGKESETK